MPVSLITGKLGSGKTLASVGQIRERLLKGCRVATNLDLNLEHMLPGRYGKPGTRVFSCVRLPDKPSLEDLQAMGCGNEEMDEDKNGIIVLDELGSWLNARTFNDKARMPVVDWLLHSRKHGWDVFFICQGIIQIDKQVRETLVEYLVTCRRLDRLKIPFVGKLINVLTGGLVKANMPKVHLATVRYGTEQHAIVADRWVYQAKDLYAAYNTRQIFCDTYDSGLYSYLPPWHLVGFRQKTWQERLAAWYREKLADPPRPPYVLKPKRDLVRLLASLDPDEAVRHWKRLDALGGFS